MRSSCNIVRALGLAVLLLSANAAQAGLVGIVDGGLSPGTPYVFTATDMADTSFLRTIKGFAYNDLGGGVFQQVSVDLIINNVVVGTTLANQPRQDIRTNRGVNIDTGFTFNLTGVPFGATSYTLSVRFNGTVTLLQGPLDPAYTTPQGVAPFRYFANKVLPMTVNLKGLRGTYFDSYDGNPLPTSLTIPRAIQVDPNADFANFVGFIDASDRPHILVAASNNGASWVGDYVPPVTGSIQLGARWDDMVVISLDGVEVYRSTGCCITAFGAAQNLTAGRRYELRFDYGEGGGSAYAQLYHQGAIPQAAIPNAQLFANRVPKVNRTQLTAGTLNVPFSTNEDTLGNFVIVAADSDGDPFTATILTQPANGVLGGTFPNLTYMPSPNFNGADSFTFRMQDQFDFSNTYTVLITVNPTNDIIAPQADTFAVLEDLPTALTVLSNDNAVDLPITVAIITPPTNGTVLVNADGTITYTSNLNYNGPDSFVYRATDTMGANTGTATVTLTVLPVNDPPVAGTDTIVTGENSVLTLATATLAANDSDPVEGDAVSIVAVSATSAAGGTVTLSGGVVIYTPPLDFFGSDSFTYTLADSGGALATGTVLLTVVEGPSFSSPPVVTPNPTVVGQQVFFTAAATYVSGPGPFTWSFGDGTGATGASVTHTYTVAGFYTVRVTATDSNGAQTTQTVQLLVSFNLEGQSGSGAINPPGEGILIGGAGAGGKSGSGKIQIDYANRQKTLFTGKLTRITFPPTVSQEALEGQLGLLTLGAGPLEQSFVFTLNDKGRGVTTSLRKIELNIARRLISFQAGGVPELTDLVESLGAQYQFTRRPALRTIKLPARITFATVPNFALAMTFQMTVKQSRTIGRGATK